MNYNLRIEIQKSDTGIVYQDENTMVVWLPVNPMQEEQGGYWESDGHFATAVMIFRTHGSDWDTVSFRAKDHRDLQDAIDDYFFDTPDEPPNINER